MSAPLAQKPSQRAADVVTEYLSTRRGAHTPIEIRARLLVLDWKAIGSSSGVPSEDQVHYTRLWLEDQRLDDARAELACVRALLLRVPEQNVSR